MRPILPPDLDLLTRVLLPVPVGNRANVMARMLAAADLADRYRKRTGRQHPQHGDGSLLAVALAHQPADAARYSAAYGQCLASVIDAIALWRARTVRKS